MTSVLTQPLLPLVEMGEEDIQQKTTKRMSRMQPTRHSSRIQDDGTDIFAKTTTMKATSFKCTSSSIHQNIPSNASLSNLEDITRVCGISLGVDDAVRIAKISFIQAKEEAAMALLNVKKKLLSSSDTENLEVASAMDSNRESVDQNIELNLEVDRAIRDLNLSQSVHK